MLPRMNELVSCPAGLVAFTLGRGLSGDSCSLEWPLDAPRLDLFGYLFGRFCGVGLFRFGNEGRVFGMNGVEELEFEMKFRWIVLGCFCCCSYGLEDYLWICIRTRVLANQIQFWSCMGCINSLQLHKSSEVTD